MMNDQDRDLILAFAAGQLSGADAEAASARIASDPELAAELASQELAMSSLSSMPAVAMTASERAGLRSNLITQLNLEPAPVAAAAPKRTMAWWKPVAGLAAAAVVAAVVVLPATLRGDADSITAAQPATDTAAVEEETLSNANDSLDGTSADTETATTEAAAQSGGESGEEPPQARDMSTDDVLDATEGNDTPAEAEDSLNAAQYKLAPVDPSRGSALESCVEQLSDELPPGDLITLGTAIIDGIESLFVGITNETGITAVASINLEACQIVDIAR